GPAADGERWSGTEIEQAERVRAGCARAAVDQQGVRSGSGQRERPLIVAGCAKIPDNLSIRSGELGINLSELAVQRIKVDSLGGRAAKRVTVLVSGVDD